jgi:hypothetical protein
VRANIGGDDVQIAVGPSEGGDEFGADLSGGADDKDVVLGVFFRLFN